jgi:hypothetical protein
MVGGHDASPTELLRPNTLAPLVHGHPCSLSNITPYQHHGILKDARV